MATNKSPITIATINFKGGVGKTTVTWCLADTLALSSDAKVLMYDLDAQMSLTQAVGLNEDTGSFHPKFQTWYDKCLVGRRTIFDAIDQFTRPVEHFDFPIGYDFIYQISSNLHFVPSVEDLYWLELEVFDRDFDERLRAKTIGQDCSFGKGCGLRLCPIRLPSFIHPPLLQCTFLLRLGADPCESGLLRVKRRRPVAQLIENEN